MRADRVRPGLLYAGTEYGMYISFDDGANWKKFQLNLPMVPVTDLTIKDNDLVVATQGRAFYVLDDLSVLQQANKNIPDRNLFVFNVNPAWRIAGSSFGGNFGTPRNAGANPPNGAVINYYVKELGDSTKGSLVIMDKNKKTIRTFTSDAKDNPLRPSDKIDMTRGMNQFVWNMLYPEAERIDGMILWTGVPGTTTAPPGQYFYKMKVGRDSAEGSFVIKADPNYKISQEDYEAQFDFLQTVTKKFNEVQKAIKDIRSIRSQLNDFIGKQGKDCPKEVKQMADSINKQLSAIEEVLYQTKSKSGQDPLNFPIRLNDKLGGVFDAASSGNTAPSKQVREVYADLARQCDEQISKLKKIMDDDLVKFNQLIREKSLPLIGVKKE
jgi:hypothetical protein